MAERLCLVGVRVDSGNPGLQKQQFQTVSTKTSIVVEQFSCSATRPLPWYPKRWFVLLCFLLLLMLLLKPVAISDKRLRHMAILSVTHYRSDDRGVAIFRLIQSPFSPVLAHLFTPLLQQNAAARFLFPHLFVENANRWYGKMVLLFAADQKFRRKYSWILCSSHNETHELQSTAVVTVTSRPLPFCKWTLFIAACNVVEQPRQFMLSTTEKHGTKAVIPYREPVRKQYDVVACFSPLFLNEHWQLLLTSLEVRRTHGLSLQVIYIQSMRAQLMQILRVYEERGIVALEKWSDINVGGSESGLDYDPNYELVWRNQEGAHTDCFLKYKVSTRFIIVSDIDDILLPRIAPTYIEEFQFLLKKQNPSAILYPRQDVNVFTSSSPQNFSIHSLLRNALLTSASATGKHVALTENVISVHLHWPGLNNLNGLLDVSYAINFMYHLRNWFYDNQPLKYVNPALHKSTELSGSSELLPLRTLISDAQMLRYQRNFEKFMNESFRKVFDNIYRKQLYYPLIDACYNEMFYVKFRSRTAIYVCPGPIRCHIPVMPGVRCVSSRIDYEHFNMSSELRVHFPTRATFVESNNGCKM